MVEERRLEVLRAIVEDFVLQGEPVGSKAVAERYGLAVSPATVRNDMATLEEEGYIVQPHTSAGRVPTDKGYRLFVDRLSTVKPLSVAERRAIESFLEGAVDLDDVVRRSVRLLAQITRQVAVVQYPSLARSTVRHIEVVSLTESRLLVVLITDQGRVEQRVVEMAVALGESDIARLRALLGAALDGKRLVDAPDALRDLSERAELHLRGAATALVTVVLEALVDKPDERVALAGTANLTRSVIDFPHTLSPVLEALEEQVVLLKLLGQADAAHPLTVCIGRELDVEGLQTTSVVSAGYGLGGLGVLGPIRMDYPGTMGAVNAVARYVGDLLGGSP